MSDKEQFETYKYFTGPATAVEQRSAIRATREAKAQERLEMEAKGYTYCERKVNEREVAYWFEKRHWSGAK